MTVQNEELVSYEYSEDGENYKSVGEVIPATPGRWVGVKAGLFAINRRERESGALKVDYFLFEKLS